ncbi:MULTISPECIES: cytochrome P450 [unclassified Mycobacterium]|uniref:cytochrome P450 n=1 Tax=unclassified Mycobacterium TaxID=2642494 RepID=UPI0029C8CC76|nr:MULTISPECIES: cytochrome P450 [unclassified Mycobacterium]
MRQAPALTFDTADPEFVRAPWERYAEIRRLGGVVYNEQVNRWMVSDFEPVRRILTTPTIFGSERGQVEQAAVFGGPTMEFYDGPHHDDMRAIWSDDFRPKALAGLRPVIAGLVRERLAPVVDRLLAGEQVEAVAELTRGIPTAVIAHMLGIEPDMVDQFAAWSDAMGASAEGYTNPGERGRELIAAGKQATAALNDYIRAQLELRRCPSHDGADLITTMVRADYACDHMTEQEIVASNTQLVFAGNETTAKLLAQLLVTLAAHPEQRRAIQADRTLIPAAVEETHRFEAITHSVFRDAIGDDATIGDVTIPADQRITLLLGAANRDPARWDRANEFDVFRKKLPHIGFAFGMHSCLGMNLAKLEAQIFLEQLVDAVPDWDVADPVDYGKNFAVRGPSAVHISVP